MRRFRSSRDLTPDALVHSVKEHTADWQYDVIALGYPGTIAGGKPAELIGLWLGGALESVQRNSKAQTTI